MSNSLKIGILGTRGIPNRYGGFEQCAEYLAVGLAKKGHLVSVYNSNTHEFEGNEWHGVEIIHCKDPERMLGTFGQFIYDYNCIKDARNRDFDILLQLGYTSNSIWHKQWPKDACNIVNMDGLEYKRSKYNKLVQQFLKKTESWAAMHGDILIADSPVIQAHLKNNYNKPSVFIPYGADIYPSHDAKALEQYGLTPYNYYLHIARMEPENNSETIIRSYLKSRSDSPLIIIGKTKNKYSTYLKKTYERKGKIFFTGGVYDLNTISNLRYYSLLYFHGHSVGGTNPSLLEAMAGSAVIAAHDNAFNKTVLGDDALYFSNEDQLTGIIKQVVNKTDYKDFIENNLEKIQNHYNWDKIIEAYESIMIEAVNKQ